MSDNIIVRSATKKDFEQVQKIQLTGGDCLLTDNDVIPLKDMELHIASSRGVFGVAESDNNIVGFIYGDLLAGRWATSSYFVVDTNHRGTTAAKKLGEWFLEKCKLNGIEYVVCYVDKNNKKLINFYQRYGFNDSGQDYIEMIKKI